MNYETYTMPQYVTDYFGQPLELTKVHGGMFCMSGSKHTHTLEARTVREAREAFKEFVRVATGSLDRRHSQLRQTGLFTNLVRVRVDLEHLIDRIDGQIARQHRRNDPKGQALENAMIDLRASLIEAHTQAQKTIAEDKARRHSE